MIDAERIEVTLIGKTGVAFPNMDATRRLHQLGFRRINKKGRTRRSSKFRVQTDFLAGYRGIHGVDHYRKIMGDELSDGPMFWFDPGAKLLMERTEHPKSKRIWYLIVDTAIGSRPDFLEELQASKSITITAVC